MNIKICKICKAEKELILFPRCKKKSGGVYYYPGCKDCVRISKKKIYNDYYQKNSDKILANCRNRYYQNIDYEHKRNKEYKQNNKDIVRARRNHFMKQKRSNDASFRIKSNISRMIRRALQKKYTSKNGLSFIKYVDYSMQKLREHLENKFESWMTWNNYGQYKKLQWDDNNSLTWTWSIDHIIPQSKLPYTSMEDENFKKCWALENLRPLSAKQNFLNGIELLRKI